MATVAAIMRAVEILLPDPAEREKQWFAAEHDVLYLPGPSPAEIPNSVLPPEEEDAEDEFDGCTLKDAPGIQWDSALESWYTFV